MNLFAYGSLSANIYFLPALDVQACFRYLSLFKFDDRPRPRVSQETLNLAKSQVSKKAWCRAWPGFKLAHVDRNPRPDFYSWVYSSMFFFGRKRKQSASSQRQASLK
jgi:hypothetical protein